MVSLTLNDRAMVDLIASPVRSKSKVTLEPRSLRWPKSSEVKATVDLMVVETTVLGLNESETPAIPILDSPVVHRVTGVQAKKDIVLRIAMIPQTISSLMERRHAD